METQATTLEELCVGLGFEGAEIATALNGDFVGRTRRPEFKLSEGDSIEIVSPREGG